MKNCMLVIFALVISLVSVLYTQSHPLPPPFYGMDPDTGECFLGTIEGTCNAGTTVRCTVTVGGNTGLPAYDVKNGTLCFVPAFRTAGGK